MENLVTVKLFSGIYLNKRVLITGHTGFKGSWLSLWLSMMGAKILGYALSPSTTPNHYSIIDVPVNSVIADIRDRERLLNVFRDFRPDIVFHMAAQPLVRVSYKDPVETFETNVLGTVNVFEACRNTPSVKAIINVTSDKCYENKEWDWGYRENDPLGGYDPYSASKGCSELITNAYRNSFFNNSLYLKEHNTLLASARAGNVIGGGDWSDDRLIPDIMKAANNNKEVLIRNPDAIRPWQHVLESLSGYLLLGQKLLEGRKEFAQSWNFGPSYEDNISVLDLTKQISKLMCNVSFKVIEKNIKNPHESKILRLNCSLAHGKLMWKNIWRSGISVSKTVDWYNNYYAHSIINSKNDILKYIEDGNKKEVIWIN